MEDGGEKDSILAAGLNGGGGVREGGRDREGSAELRARQTAYSQHIMAIIRQRGEVDRGGLREKRREEEEEGGRRE